MTCCTGNCRQGRDCEAPLDAGDVAWVRWVCIACAAVWAAGLAWVLW